MAESGNGPGASGDRRGFLVWLTRGFLGLWAVGGGAAIAAYMRPPERHDTSSENVVRVGLLGDYRIGEAGTVPPAVTPFFVIRLDETRVVALSAVCTHVRCILGFDPEKKTIVCPCPHGPLPLPGHAV